MFYRCDDGREPGDGLLGLLADAAAILGQARDFGKDELEYIAKCAADFGHFLETVDEAVAQAEANPHADAHVGIMFPNLGEQMGILAVIELLALANEHQRDAYLPICLKALEFLSHVDLIYEEDEDDDGGMLRELDAFTCEVCTRLFRLAALSPSWQDRLLDTVWLWCKNLQGQITGHSKPFAIHAAVAALIGIYRSFKSQHAAIISRNAKGLRDLFEDTLSEEKLRIVAQTSTAIHSDEDIPSVPIEGYTALNWITALVEGVRDVLAASLRLEDYSSTCFREIWQDLAKTRAQSRIVTESTMPTQDALAGIYYACWHPDWRHTLVRHLSVDADALSDVYTSLVHVAVLCSLHVPSLQRNLLQNLNAILDDTTVVIESTTLDVYLATIEGLAIVSTNSETAAASSSKALMTFLTQPATVFINAEGDACAILRECTCRSLSNILALASESNNRKTALYTFANTLHSTHNKIITATTAKTDAGRRYQNAVAAIASLCSVLKAKETIEVAIPALARRLDDSQTIFDDFIWKNLGNIGLTNDTDVFRNIITFILDYSKRTFSKISKISHTLARMPGRPVELLELYLEKLLALFAEKATTLLRNPADTNVIAELRDIMSIVKVVCEQEHFHPQSLAATYTELTYAFRNAWFYIVLFVLTPAGAWPKEWQYLLKVIASKTPPLLLDRKHRSLEADLGANSILQGCFPDSVSAKIKAQLAAALPSKAVEIRNLSFASSVYLLAVYHIESMRIRTMSVDFMCRYLVDERLYNTDLYPILETLCDELLKLLIRDQVTKHVDTRVIEHNLQCMLLYAAHRMTKARRFASRWIVRILEVLPRMLWNHKAAFLMMDILRFLDNRKAGYTDDGFRNPLLAKLFFLDEKEAALASADFMLVAEAWLKSALKQSSGETIGLAQTYLVEISNKSPYTMLNDQSDLMVLLGRFVVHADVASTIIRSPSKHSKFLGEIKGMIFALEATSPDMDRETVLRTISANLKADVRRTYRTIDEPNFAQRVNQSVFRAAALIITNEKVETELLQLICYVPSMKFDTTVMEIAVTAWTWLMTCRPELVKRMLAYLIQAWELTASTGKGLYGVESGSPNPFLEKMTYGAPKPHTGGQNNSEIHIAWIRFFINRFRADRLCGSDHLKLYTQLFLVATQSENALKSNWSAREARFDLALLGLRIAVDLDAGGHKEAPFVWTQVFDVALGWFEHPPMFGRIKKDELKKLVLFYQLIKDVKLEKAAVWSTSRINRIFLNMACDTDRIELSDAQQLLMVLLEHEMNRLATWLSPLEDASGEFAAMPPPPNERLIKWQSFVRIAWYLNPIVAIQLASRFVTSAETIESEIVEVAKYNEIAGLECPDAVSLFLKHSWRHRSDDQLRYLLFWAPVPPIVAISMLGQPQRHQPWVLQYAVRVLEYFPIEQVFFYVPQMVQALRYDAVGYVERFILEAAKTSQLFAHQIIWNMKANMFKDESCETPDSLKPALDRIIARITSDLSGGDKEFYEREFNFFAEVTGISGTLKPLVQADASKAEKKRKIDEEIRKIKVQVGVYLPTNPESIVVDIDYDSGRPLQSHAKAPFMATFKVRDAMPGALDIATTTEPRWMSSIFKVGDDCRQDVLALQLISLFKSIFASAGLELYTFPYRVVATAPGCGVIEVIPRSISRDMMGREKVNSLYDWFIAEFGPEDSIEFQKARNEFVKSLAAYSLIMFIVQIKDRHNGNIMFDKEGHMVHIDFGFILSIAPGGGILEVSPFKLTSEMVQVMGGDITAPAYKLFSELCVKAYLACRPYAEEIISMVSLMMDSGLPCFKGEVTIRKLRERFQLDKSERVAAEFMINCIRQSHENMRSGLYDRFQYLQNGIPFK